MASCGSPRSDSVRQRPARGLPEADHAIREAFLRHVNGGIGIAMHTTPTPRVADGERNADAVGWPIEIRPVGGLIAGSIEPALRRDREVANSTRATSAPPMMRAVGDREGAIPRLAAAITSSTWPASRRCDRHVEGLFRCIRRAPRARPRDACSASRCGLVAEEEMVAERVYSDQSRVVATASAPAALSSSRISDDGEER